MPATPEVKQVMDEFRPRFTALAQAGERAKQSVEVWKKMYRATTAAEARRLAEDFLQSVKNDDIPF